MLSNEKIEIIKKLECDEADLILRLHEYHTEKYSLNNTRNVFENLDIAFNAMSNESENPFFVVFSDGIAETSHKTKNTYIVPFPQADEEFNEKNYYAGKALDKRLSQNYLNDEIKTMLKNNKNIIFVIDVKDVSTYPIWNTNMRRKAITIFERIKKEQNINCKTIAKIINNSIPAKIVSNQKYDLDFLIQFFKEANEITDFKTIYITKSDTERAKEEIFFINEFEKFVHALKLKENKYDYIYDTLCSDMDTMFSNMVFVVLKIINVYHRGIKVFPITIQHLAQMDVVLKLLINVNIIIRMEHVK